MDDESRQPGMSSLYENNGELLVSIISFAPSGNVRIALMQLVDYLLEEGEDAQIDSRIILEIITRGIIRLGFEDSALATIGQKGEFENMSIDEITSRFRQELGLDEESTDE